MTKTEIKRIRTVATVEGEVSIPSMQKDAEEILGYKKPQASGVLPDTISAALAKLEIDHLDWRDVVAYQAEIRANRGMEMASGLMGGSSVPNVWSRRGPEWTETEISKFSGYVPDHILHKAVEIKRELPEVTILIEHLSDDRDPFLVVRNGSEWNGQTYFIDVWDEPGFERR